MRKSYLAALALLLAAPAWSEPKTYALLIGIDHFRSSALPNSRYAVADARLVAQALQDVCHVPAQNILLMTSDSPDESSVPILTNVVTRLAELRQKVGKDDTFIFYYAGASQTVDGLSFLLTPESDPRSGATLRFSALRGLDLTDLIGSYPCSQTLVLFDACRKGGNALDPAFASLIPRAKVAGHTAAYFACGVGEQAGDWEEKRHGAYAYFFVNGLRQQGADRQGHVTLQGLSDYVNAQVTGKIKTQHPVLRYAGSQPSQWLLASVKPAGKQDDTPKFVAELEAARARLDIEVARRKAAEARANREESRRREVEQSLEILERQLGGKGQGMTTAPSAPSPDLEVEAARLRAENDRLRARIEASGARGVSFENWEAARKSVDGGGALAAAESLDGSTPKLRLEQWIRGILVSQMAKVEKSYGPAWGQGPEGSSPQVLQELAFLKDRLKAQRESTELYGALRQHAETALAESNQRLAEAEARVQVYEATIRNLTSKIRENDKKIAELTVRQAEAEKVARDAQQRAADLEKRLAESEDWMASKFRGTPLARDWTRVTRRARLEDFSGTVDVGEQREDFGK